MAPDVADVALVTGAGSGIGRAFATVFAEAGWRIACLGRRPEALLETVALIRAEGGRAWAFPCNITDYAATESAVRATETQVGKIGLVINNAGSFGSVGPLWDADPEQWANDIQINVIGTFHVCRAVLPILRQRNRGVIVNLDGGGGANGTNPGGSGYGTSKAAVVRFTETLAGELERDGSAITTFCISPGLVRTAMTENLVTSPWHTVAERFERGKDRPADWCARTVLALLDRPDLSKLRGAVLSEDTDPNAPEPRWMRAVRIEETR
jgi:NAD(P)-dependent dehydrogenase (short-subunit alcohol dehydrogenase family)